MIDSYAVHLGGGAYLDASGNILFAAASGAQIYQAPGGFRLDTKELQDAHRHQEPDAGSADTTPGPVAPVIRQPAARSRLKVVRHLFG